MNVVYFDEDIFSQYSD